MNIPIKRLKTIYRFKYRKGVNYFLKNFFWFFTGALLTLVVLSGIGFLSYQTIYQNQVYPGITVEGKNFGGKTKEEVKKYFDEKNERIGKSSFILTSDYGVATVSAEQIGFGYDSTLLSEQAYLLGRSFNFLSNISILTQAYINGVNLSPAYSLSDSKLEAQIGEIKKKIDKEPVDALFKFENGRVTAFKQAENGQAIDMVALKQALQEKTFAVVSAEKPTSIVVAIPIKETEPEISTEEANDLGIKELIGVGSSLFYHSIPSRIHNIGVATSRINGVIIKPGEEFSFNKALGDVSAFTGYQQAYIIQNGKTVLGDGGGVCQVSTTFFRAILDAGLPITERSAHAYRVSYYENDSPPGFDATIYVPTVDLKFKNDTGSHILVQSEIDYSAMSLKFYFYGAKDGRKATVSKAVIYNQSPAPEPLYQEDPTLPVGTVKQVDFAAAGASVYFDYVVEKNGEKIIEERYYSNYRPWRAIFLQGTKPI
jgi:vancomycin resistance protein YoaR